MGEFSQIMQLVTRQLEAADPQLEVMNAFPKTPRKNPQKEKLAVVGIQKVSLQPMGLENFYGENLGGRGRKAEVWVKVSFCCPSGELCWSTWEAVLSAMMFSEKIKVRQAECEEPSWKKEWGGIVLPVRFCLDFIISGTGDSEESEIHPEQFRIIRKGETV